MDGLSALLSNIDSMPQSQRAARRWKTDLNRLLSDFAYAAMDAAYERSLAKTPEAADKFWSDYSPAEKRAFYESLYDIKTEILDAIYLNDPDWLKILEAFGEVRADVLKALDQMDFAPETRRLMIEKISSIELSLPYEDPRTADSRPSCSESEDNGYYMPLANRFVICMGTVNISQNDGAFYGTMAHEIAHSIDPNVFLEDIFKKTALARLLSRVYDSSGSLPCGEWEREKAAAFAPFPEIYSLPPGLGAIDQCLADRSGLDDLNSSSLDYAGKRRSEMSMDSYASWNDFSYLTAPEIFKKGHLKANEFYLNPKLFAESENQYFESMYFLKGGSFHPPSVFVQEYKCRLLQPEANEEAVFAESLEETKRLSAAYEYNRSSVLGRNSRSLAGFNLSRPSDEDFADYLADKAVEMKLQRISSLESRRSFSLSRGASYCQPDSLERLAKNKILIEKRHSRSFHSPNIERQLKNFTQKKAELLQCRQGEGAKKLEKNCSLPLP